METITRIAQIAKPMIVFTVFLLQDAHSEASSNYGAMGQGAIEGFSQGGYCHGIGVWEWKPLVGTASGGDY
jgi:hypothetical protein